MIFVIFLSNRLLPPTSEADYGQTVGAIKKSPKLLYRIGTGIMCTDFCEIRIKSVGGGAKSVF